MNLLGKGNNPNFWSETVRNKDCFKSFRDYQFKQWDNLCIKDDEKALKYTEFRMFGINGNRAIFERSYFDRRIKLETAVILSLIYPEEQKYLDFAMDMIFDVCNEYTWAIPAHIPNILTEINRTHLDLFACETSFMLAEVYTLLGDRLDPLIRKLITAELDKRVIQPFLSGTRYNWYELRENWAAVCGSSVGCMLMLMRPDIFASEKPRLDKIMDNYLSGFKDDGFCAEGLHYWHYGFGFFCTYADMLRTFTGGKENYFERDKVHKVATFIQKMFISENVGVSFTDSPSKLEYHIGLLHFLHGEYDDVKVYSPNYSYINDRCGRFCLLVRAATWFDEDTYNNPEEDSASSEYYAAGTQWLIKRTKSYGFAGKAGHNREFHNHNDIGSFIIAKNGKHLLTDMGAGVYSDQYFKPATRYGMIECSSLGHSTPHFGDLCQKYGSEYAASDVKFENGIFSFEMAGAYGDETVKSIKRAFSFTESTITLTDEFEYTGNEKISERFVTRIKPELLDGKVLCETLTINYGDDISSVSVTETLNSHKATVYLIDFVLRDDCKKATFTFE